MKGLPLLLQAFRLEKSERVPWVPFVGVHGARLIGLSAKDYLQNAGAILSGLQKAYELYLPDGLPIMFDLQLEAEVLGCQLHWADQMPPSVTSHPLLEKSIASLPPFELNKGRFPLVKKVAQQLKKQYGQDLALYGLVTGPFTLAMHLMGNDLFLKLMLAPSEVKEIMDFTTRIATETACFYMENGADIIALVDPMTSQISSEHFQQFVFEEVNTIFNAIRQHHHYSSFFVCGDASRNLELMFQTNSDYVSIDENISLAWCRDLSQKYKKAFGGNLKLTSVLLFGSVENCKSHALECLETGGQQGFILSPGCDIPFNCPPENLKAVAEIVHNPYQREIFKQLQRSNRLKEIPVELPDYPNNPFVLIEVITLDSATCAPCQYMVQAATKAAANFGGKVKVIEHKISTRAGLAYMKKLGVRSIPSLCIEGRVEFSSIIPDQEQLKKRIAQLLLQKLSDQENH